MNQDIEALKEELEDLKNQMILKSMLLSKKIDALESQISTRPSPKQQNEHSSAPSSSPKPKVQEAAKHQALVNEAAISEAATIKASEAEATQTQQPSFIEVALMQLLSMVIDWFSPVTTLYESYKQRGMLGIFFLTIAGVGLVLSGFGYLMQLVVDELGAGSKAALLGSSALSVVALGLVLKVRTKYAEFASAIVSLGLLLCFLTIYFVGSVYALLPALVTLSIYALIALACHYLALYLETKVVAVMGIVGITLIPIIAGASNIAPTFYLMSVWLVSVSSLYIAFKYLGHWLSNITFVFAFVTLGWVEANSNLKMAAWMINAFYLLFFTYFMFCLYANREDKETESTLTKYLVLIASNFGASLLLMLQSNQFGFTELALQFLLNGFVSLIVAVYLFREKHRFTHLASLIAAAWTVLAIIALLAPSYWGIAWAIEGLLLIYMSRRYALAQLIHHGQALSGIAILYCAAAIYPYFPNPALLTLDGWVIAAVIGLTLSAWQRLIRLKNEDSKESDKLLNSYTLKDVYPVLVFAETAYLSLIALSCAFIWLDNWAGLTAIIVQIAILFRARQTQRSQLELLAAALIIFPLAYVAIGAESVNSLRFSLLPTFAKASLILAFVQLWLWSAFYRKFYPQSPFASVAELARLAFYFLLPICWLGSAFRHFEAYIGALLWLSPALSLVLAHFIKAAVLRVQSQILSVLLVAYSIFSMTLLQSWSGQYYHFVNDLALLAGLTVLASIAFYLHKLGAESALKETNRIEKQKQLKALGFYAFIQSSIVNFAAILLAIFVGVSISSVLDIRSFTLFSELLPFALITSYPLLAFVFAERFTVFKRNLYFHAFTLLAISVLSWLTLLNGGRSELFVVIYPIIVLATAVYTTKRLANLSISKRINAIKNKDLIGHSYALITYLLAFMMLNDVGADLAIAPVMAVHGAAILFLKNRRIASVRFSFGLILLGIAKLALVDAAQVVLWQKVIMFIGIGVFILLASFWYQKLVAADKEHSNLSAP
ncbi:DUF2339 domain-containing protein [Glaciecola sp. MH2013]|uniref:DUF2339 domain-containing protein n=1 Tax=Glaciecola sp. MH2013 TaxID=2785524 RepID=UPI00189E0401|nr:DUF2339 domain-containing protein [Glaciecola sp. MH2013]MBF7072115.1 DUF2339 domain-containing protein [Glaciecola sp. MH2013]